MKSKKVSLKIIRKIPSESSSPEPFANNDIIHDITAYDPRNTYSSLNPTPVDDSP